MGFHKNKTSTRERSSFVIPGEAAGVIEEGEPKGDYYLDDGLIRAKKMSTVNFDLNKRIIYVRGVDVRSKPPAPGDEVIGIVIENLPEDMQRIRIVKINNKPSDAKFTAILIPLVKSSKPQRYQQAKIGDIVRARIIGEANGIIFATINERNMGVLWTRCSLCGGAVTKYRENTVKCRKCGNIEHRKLAPDFLAIKAII